MSEDQSLKKINNIAPIKNYDFYKNKHKNIDINFNPSTKNKATHYIYDQKSETSDNYAEYTNSDDINMSFDSCNNCINSSNEVTKSNSKKLNKHKKGTYHKNAKGSIKNLNIENQDLNIEPHILKLNTSNYIFSDNLVKNVDILINTWENIIFSIYKFKSDIENLLNELSDNVELTINDLNMNLKCFDIAVNGFINDLIIATKIQLTNKKNVCSVIVSRKDDSLDDLFSHIITKPKKLAYYLNANNILTLFTIPIFGINYDTKLNHLVIQVTRQKESVSTTHSYNKLENTLYTLSRKFSCESEFMRNDSNEITNVKSCINTENSFKYLSHYYCSIINDLDIYHYDKSDLHKLLNDLNLELEKLKYIRKTYSDM